MRAARMHAPTPTQKVRHDLPLGSVLFMPTYIYSATRPKKLPSLPTYSALRAACGRPTYLPTPFRSSVRPVATYVPTPAGDVTHTQSQLPIHPYACMHADGVYDRLID